jgi:hypothetical protein
MGCHGIAEVLSSVSPFKKRLGIPALECIPFKAFTRLSAKRLTVLTNSQMPDIQFGFRRGRSMLQAAHNLLNDAAAAAALRLPGQKLFAIFMDFSKAFDMLNRTKLVTELGHVTGLDHTITRILRDILAYNYVQTDSISKDMTQTNGVLQGDPPFPSYSILPPPQMQ